jgi:5'-3' exonuclease
VYNPTKEKLITPANFEAEVGIDACRFIDWKALQGDSSDNIPGVAGIGEKTATKLFNELKTLTGITNAAIGKNPNGKGKMSDKIALSIVSFGFERICKNIFVMALYADRVGARQALTDAVMGWKPGDPKRLKKYIMMNAFVSLLDTLPGQVLNMKQPYFIQDVFRAPTFCARRVAIL